MIVYRVIKYECDDLAQIERMFTDSIHGVYLAGGLKITACPVTAADLGIGTSGTKSKVEYKLADAAAVNWAGPKSPSRRAAVARSQPSSGFLAGSADAEAAELVRRIDALLESGEYNWAEDTLTGIRETIEKTGCVTEKQLTAIDNIEKSQRWHSR
jgi:hypothetical protein